MHNKTRLNSDSGLGPKNFVRYALLIGWVLVMVVCAGARGSQKPLWYDELFSASLAGLPTPVDIWLALMKGVDPWPPLYYLAAHEASSAFSASPWTLRFPSLFGLVVLSLCLYGVVAHRLSPALAWTAALFPMLTSAWFYAYEARGYGMILGFSGLALYAWQAATEGKRRPLALFVISLSLGAAVATHYFAILIFIPLGIGELVRSWIKGCVDWVVWMAFILGLTPLPFLIPLMSAAANEYGADFWAKGGWTYIPEFYNFVIGNAVIPLVAILVIVALDVRRTVGTRGSAEDRAASVPIPWHELAAAVGFVALPVFGFLLAKVTTGGSFLERYALPAVIGPSLLIAYVATGFRANLGFSVVALPIIFFSWFLFNELNQIRRGPDPDMAVDKRIFTTAEQTDLPIVVSNPKLYLQAFTSLPSEIADRLTFVCLETKTTDDRALRKLSLIRSLKTSDLDPFLREHKRFYLVGAPGDPMFGIILDDVADVNLLQSGRFRGREIVLAFIKYHGATRISP